MAKAGRRKVRAARSPEEAQARDEGKQRRLYRAGNSWVVAVPKWVRKAVGRAKGGHVYWHVGPRGSVGLTGSPERVGGRPPGEALQQQIERLERENTKLRRRLRARPLAVFNEGASAGASAVLRQTVTASGDIAAMLDRLKRIEEQLGRMPWARRTRRERTARHQVEQAPAPLLEAPSEAAVPLPETEQSAALL